MYAEKPKVMEKCDESLSTESFSYSWLVNRKPSNFDSMEYEEEAAFIEMDPSLSPSKRFSNVNPHDFINFNFPISDKHSPSASIMKNMESSSSVMTKKKEEVNNSSRRRLGIFHKLLDFLKPLCKKISFGCKSTTSTRVEGPIVKKWESSEGTSLTPRTSIANYSEDDWRRSCDSEASIYEAVLHCKRTISGDE